MFACVPLTFHCPGLEPPAGTSGAAGCYQRAPAENSYYHLRAQPRAGGRDFFLKRTKIGEIMICVPCECCGFLTNQPRVLVVSCSPQDPFAENEAKYKLDDALPDLSAKAVIGGNQGVHECGLVGWPASCCKTSQRIRHRVPEQMASHGLGRHPWPRCASWACWTLTRMQANARPPGMETAA